MIPSENASKMIIDGHVHIGVKKSSTYPETIIRELTKHNIDKALVMTSGKNLNNEWVATQIKKYPQYFIGGYVTLDPQAGDRAIEELDNAIKNWGLNALKLVPQKHGYSPNDRIAEPLLEKASELKIPVSIHSGEAPYTTPWQIAECAEKYSDLTIIMAHMGGKAYIDDAIQLAKKIDNIVLENSVQASFERTKKAVDVLGADRVFYASGAPNCHHITPLMIIKLMELSEDDEELILSKNLLRIFNLTLSE